MFSCSFLGISTWGKRVGRKLDQMKGDNPGGGVHMSGSASSSSTSNLHLMLDNPSKFSNHYVVNAPLANNPALSEADLEINRNSRAQQLAGNPGRPDSDTIEFLVVNDDLILQRRSHTVSQPDLVMGSGQDTKAKVKRRVSRVESLRNLFFSKSGNGNSTSGIEAKKRFLMKKRARSAEKTTEKVRKDN